MVSEVYVGHYNATLTGLDHFQHKMDWLWREFAKTYLPSLLTEKIAFVPRPYRIVAEEQRTLLYVYYKDLWQYWEKWRKYLLDLPGIHGELIFRKEYS